MTIEPTSLDDGSGEAAWFDAHWLRTICDIHGECEGCGETTLINSYGYCEFCWDDFEDE